MRRKAKQLARGGVYGRRKARGSSRSRSGGTASLSSRGKKRPGLVTQQGGSGTRVEDYRAPYYKSFGVGSRSSGSSKKNLGH